VSNAFIRVLATDPAHPGDRLRIMRSEGCDIAGLIAETVRAGQVDQPDAEVIAIRECMALGPVERRWLRAALDEMDRAEASKGGS
jgi:hypothetical protein